MTAFLKKIYHLLSRFRIVKKMGDIYCNGFFISNLLADRRLKRTALARHEKKDRISVVFLCQYRQAWNKVSPVFEKMLEDGRFAPLILAVPEYINSADDEIYRYFHSLYKDHTVNAYEGGKWYDLHALHPDYVFYQRPYDQYLPSEYRSGIVSCYAKIWYISYAYDIIQDVQGVGKSKLFFRNVHLYFAENKIDAEFNRKRFSYSHKKGFRKTCDIGYPVMETLMKHKRERTDDVFRVMWSPRWSDDKATGGSNFLHYKDEAVRLPQKIENLSLVFRPHPMTFRYFLEHGKLTQEEADRYLALYRTDDRLFYDDRADYVDTFWNIDVLLTDVSSIIVEFFITGKPIIYCDTGAAPNRIFTEMLKVMYVVHSWTEAEKQLMELAQGNDPLKEARNKKIKELMGDDFTHISDRFTDEIYNDFTKNHYTGEKQHVD